MAFDTINYWFQYQYESKVTAIATFIAYTVTSIYKIILLVFQKDVKWFAFSNAVDYMVLAFVLLLAYKKYNGPIFRFSLNKCRSLLTSSYHYILSGMMVAIYGQTDKMMLKHMLDENAVGYYSLATSINSMWVFILAAIIDSMYPTIIRLFDTNKEAFNKKNKQLYAIVIYFSVGVGIIFCLFGKFAIQIIYGEDYVRAAEPLKIIAWYTVFSYLGVARNAWIVCEGKQKYLKYMYLGAAIINIFLNLLMIPLYGASGAALASLVTQIMTSMLLPALFKDMRPNVKLMVDAFFLKELR